MNFGFDEQQKSFGDSVSQLLADHPALTAPNLTVSDTAVWDALAELGLFALLVPERFGGVGMALVDLALAVEALGAGLAPQSVTSTLAATDAIIRHGSEAQRLELLPRIATGSLRIAVAVLEADQGYNPHDARTAVAAGRLSGSKILVGDAACADLILVVARTADGTTLVIVEPGAAGVNVRAHDDLDPTSGFAEVTFDHVAVAPGAVLGEGSGEPAVDRLFDVSATLHAGLLTGISAHMLEKAVDYARVRVQFGQAIGAFQAIKHRCADMAVALEAGRSTAYYGFWAVAEAAPDAARAASMAKAYCGDVARQICNETIQVHGGMGFTWELGLHRYLRRAKVIEHSFGDAAWHNERILAETLRALQPGEERQLDAA